MVRKRRRHMAPCKFRIMQESAEGSDLPPIKDG